MKSLMAFSILLAFLALCVPVDAKAVGFGSFGKDEHIRFLANTTIPGPGQSRLYLGHLVETRIFLLPYCVKSRGYVLGISGESSKYIPLPQGEKLQELQANGYLPNPLPSIEFTAFDYVMGYMLWFFIPFSILAILWKSALEKQIRKRIRGHRAGS